MSRTVMSIWVSMLLALHAVHAQSTPQATQKTIAEMIAAAPSAKIKTFIEVAKTAGLYDKITGATFTGTLLIPSDTAFAALLKALNATKTELLSEKELLKTVLSYHVSPTVIPKIEAFSTLTSIPTLLAGRTLRGINLGASLGIQGDVNNAALVSATEGISGLVGSGATINAAVYTIDGVLIPNMSIANPTPAATPEQVRANATTPIPTTNITAPPAATSPPSKANGAGSSTSSVAFTVLLAAVLLLA